MPRIFVSSLDKKTSQVDDDYTFSSYLVPSTFKEEKSILNTKDVTRLRDLYFTTIER
jgi:hypothetical protein